MTGRPVKIPLRLPNDVDEEEIRQEIKKLGIKYPETLSTEALTEEYKKYKAVKDLLPEEVWANYLLLGMRDSREQLLLRAARNELRQKVYQIKREYKEQLRLKRMKEKENAKKDTEHQATKGATKKRSHKRQRESSTEDNS